jgi:O86/O127-antigen biosynthesis beta-1,3-galactosyltransferase
MAFRGYLGIMELETGVEFMFNPLISVVMPYYNVSPSFLEIAIESVLTQDYVNLELILVDDGSTITYDLRKFNKDKRVFLYILKSNYGISYALNYGIQKSTGEIIARMDSDDVSLPHRLSSQIRLLNKHDIVTSNVYLINKMGEVYGKSSSFIFHDTIRKFQLYFLGYNPVNHPTIIAWRRVFDQFKYDSKFDGKEDLELWLRMRKSYKIYFDKNYLLHYRK